MLPLIQTSGSSGGGGGSFLPLAGGTMAGTIVFDSSFALVGGGKDALQMTVSEAAASTFELTAEDGGVQAGTGKHDWAFQFGYNVSNNIAKKATESAVYWGFESNYEQTPGDATSSQSEFYLTAITPNAAGGGPGGGPITTRVFMGYQNKLTGFIGLNINVSTLTMTSAGGQLALTSAGNTEASGNVTASGGSVIVGGTDVVLNKVAATTLGVGSAVGGGNHIGTLLVGALGIRSDVTLPSAFTFGSATTGSKLTIEINSAVYLALSNYTAATVATPGNSPSMYFAGSYWDGAASALSQFQIQNVVDAGTNGAGRLVISYTGAALPTIDTPRVCAADGLVSSPAFAFASERGLGLYRISSHALGVTSNNFLIARFNYNDLGFSLLNGSGLAFSSGTTDDASLTRIGAAALAIGDGFGGFTGSLKLGALSQVNATAATNVTPQASPILTLSGQYWNGAASAESAFTLQVTPDAGTNGINWLKILQSAGYSSSGSSPRIQLLGTSGIVHFGSAGNSYVNIDNGAHYGTDFFSTGGNGFQAAAGGYFFWLGRSQISSPANGNILLTNTAANSFGLLQLGGTSAAFPSIKRNGAGVETRLADDSDFCLINVKSVKLSGGNSLSNNGSQLEFGNTASYTNLGFFTGTTLFAVMQGAQFDLGSGSMITWEPNANPTIGINHQDTGISRLGVASLAIGNGTAGDFAGKLKLTTLTLQGKIDTYNAVATVGAGVPSLIATVDSTGLTAAVGTTTLYAVPASGAGLYRISFYAKITTVGSVSSVLGGTNGFQLTWTDPTDSTVPTAAVTDTLGSALNGNTTTTVAAGAVVIAAKASTNIQYAYDYTSSLANTMTYKLSIKVEFLG